MFKFSDTDKFQIMKTITMIADHKNQLKDVSCNEVNKPTTAVFVVDMINGFVKEGALADARIKGIIPAIEDMLKTLDECRIVFVNDAHSDESEEFKSYPAHCTKDSEEGKIVSEFNKYTIDATIIEKNSTNGFVSDGFKKWLKAFDSVVDTYIIVGDCTDICIKQFAMTLKAHFNEQNKSRRIIVPAKAVETFHLDATNHHAGLMNLISLYEMEQGGIEIVKCVR